MNTEFIMPMIGGVSVALLLVGIYKTAFEPKVQTQERVSELLGQPKTPTRGGVLGVRDQENILKRRKRSKDGQQTTIDKLEIQLERANVLITPHEFVLICLGAGLAATFVFRFLFGQSMPVSILLGAVSVGLPYVYILIKAMLRMKKAAAQFADVLDAMVNGFKTGFGFSRAVQMIADNFEDPWGTEFGKMAAEMNLGASQEDVLYSLSNRIPSTDVDLFVTALLIQKETGGSLAELLGNLSKTIRDRYKLFQKVGAISAQGKLSAGIVCCVPFLLCGLMFLFLPEAMMRFCTSPIGIVLLIVAGIWMICGIGVLYKIVQIEV